jgi:hypothetical protein
MEDLGVLVDVRIILKRILKKYFMRVYTEKK